MSDMGSVQEFRQSVVDGQPIVAFDFDGTLTIRDSFTEFLRWRAGPGGWMLGLVRLAPAVAAYARNRDRGRIKAASVREFLLGVDRATLEADAARFADQIWPRFMRPDAMKTWDEWGERGAHRVIVTASPTSTVAPFARKLGAEALLGTEFVFDADDRITGEFAGPNCRAEEKVRRLKAAYGQDMVLTAAYGDTSGDTEMLAMAQEPGFRVFTQKP
ncbi:phosphatidylglycerophosphatase C [Brevundimonas nasdae]|uniref:HAD-IB family hydrolase n=1 Tax=Brevundimonas nasdae TaxID=172043 RepID=UPI001911DBBE|nr:HAD-IB family hydrolase [Brevundimonas nasdae]MBK6026480.1 HAD-IB family hydrolase [Brevundimonas nasdae]MDQ0453039.1 phosphatidylglycerophosphatase C [Brevundimonas nasdae]